MSQINTIDCLTKAINKIQSKADAEIKALEKEYVETHRKYPNGFKFKYQGYRALVADCYLYTRVTQNYDPYLCYVLDIPGVSETKAGEVYLDINQKITLAEVHIDNIVKNS